MDNYIKISPSIITSDWYKNSKARHLLFHLLLKANRVDDDRCDRGQLLTTLGQLILQVAMTMQELRTCMNHLRSEGELTINAENKKFLLTLVKYNDYALDDNGSSEHFNHNLLSSPLHDKTARLRMNEVISSTSLHRIDWGLILFMFNRLTGNRLMQVSPAAKRNIEDLFVAKWRYTALETSIIECLKHEPHHLISTEKLTLEFCSDPARVEKSVWKNFKS